MQDKQKNDIDPTFIDYAWDQMRAQLDEAMPVEERRRKRGLWLWFLMFIILGSTWVTLRAFGPKGIEESPQPASKETPIATSKPSSDDVLDPTSGEVVATSIQQETHVVATEEQDNPLLQTTASASSLELLNQPLEQPVSVTSESLTPSIVSNHTPAETSPLNQETPIIENVIVAESDHNPSATPAELGTIPAEVSSLNNEEDQLGLVATVPRLAFFPNQKTFAESMPPTTAVAKNALHLFAEGMLGSGLDDPAQLLHLGAGAQLDLNSQFAIEGGLAYEAYHLGELSLVNDSQDAVLVNFEDVDPASWGGANYTVAVPFDSAVSNVTAHRIAMPVNIRWSPSAQSPWQFSLGGTAVYYLQALVKSELPESLSVSQRSSVANFDLYNENQPLFVLDSAAEDISNPSGFIARPLEVTRWEWSWTAAVGYRFSPRLEGQVQYRGLFNDWPNSKEKLGPNSFAQLSLRYYLK